MRLGNASDDPLAPRDRFTSASRHPELTVGEFAVPPAIAPRITAVRPAPPLLLRRRVMGLLLLAGALAALLFGHDAARESATVAPSVPPPQRESAEVLLPRIATWIAENFDLPAASEMPRVILSSPEQIAARRYGHLLARAGTGEELRNPHVGQVVAVYDTVREVIYLPEGWIGASPAEQSVLVHEMVHHLQKKAQLRFDCPQQREKLAYQAQERWLERFGTSLEQEFGLDRFSLFVHFSCL